MLHCALYETTEIQKTEPIIIINAILFVFGLLDSVSGDRSKIQLSRLFSSPLNLKVLNDGLFSIKFQQGDHGNSEACVYLSSPPPPPLLPPNISSSPHVSWTPL